MISLMLILVVCRLMTLKILTSKSSQNLAQVISKKLA
uniref:Uncharacterized protein n=1 Tax=Rhizophora mucronata TaxID=61149 RepID=A0A2P2NPB7_RHIMU